MIELIGYLGSLFVAVSLLMSNVLRLRIINLIGAMFFVVYGFAISAYSVFAANLFVVLVDAYYIYEFKSKKDIFKFVKTDFKSNLLKYFLSYNGRDIMNFFPRFSDSGISSCECFLIMRNLSVVGVFIFQRESENIRVLLDYIISDYRDLKTARCFFNSSQVEEEFRGYQKIIAETDNKSHEKYLLNLGFLKSASSPHIFEKKIN